MAESSAMRPHYPEQSPWRRTTRQSGRRLAIGRLAALGPDAVGEADDVETTVLVGEPDLAPFGDDPRLGRGEAGIGAAEPSGGGRAVAAGVEVGDLPGTADIADVEDTQAGLGLGARHDG